MCEEKYKEGDIIESDTKVMILDDIDADILNCMLFIKKLDKSID